MHTLVLIAIWTGLVFQSRADEDAVRLVARWLGDPRTFGTAEVTATLRPKILAELKKQDVTGDAVNRGLARLFLIELGDQVTGQNIVAALSQPGPEAHEVLAVFARTTQPWVIPMLVPALMRDEAIEQPYPSSSEHLPQSAAAAGCILLIAEHSPAFSAEVRASAKQAEFPPNVETYRSVARQWWAQNKEHFAKKEYAAVMPLPPVANPTPPQKPLTHPQAPPPTPPSKPATPVASAASHRLLTTVQASFGSALPVGPQAVSPKTIMPLPVALTGQAEPNWVPWEFVAAGALLLTGIVGLIVLYKKRRLG